MPTSSLKAPGVSGVTLCLFGHPPEQIVATAPCGKSQAFLMLVTCHMFSCKHEKLAGLCRHSNWHRHVSDFMSMLAAVPKQRRICHSKERRGFPPRRSLGACPASQTSDKFMATSVRQAKRAATSFSCADATISLAWVRW
eukprot:1159081-Pelagomonas_calceolata.AAC.4